MNIFLQNINFLAPFLI